MASDQPPEPNSAPKRKHDLSSRRAFLLGLYIFVLVVLVKLYWPGWPFPDKAAPPPPAATHPSGTQVPQN
jgi:hypothetical protein